MCAAVGCGARGTVESVGLGNVVSLSLVEGWDIEVISKTLVAPFTIAVIGELDSLGVSEKKSSKSSKENPNPAKSGDPTDQSEAREDAAKQKARLPAPSVEGLVRAARQHGGEDEEGHVQPVLLAVIRPGAHHRRARDADVRGRVLRRARPVGTRRRGLRGRQP